jgi:hypothetical protein
LFSDKIHNVIGNFNRFIFHFLRSSFEKLLETIEQQLDAAEESGVDPIRLAPQRYWEMLGRAKKMPSELMERVVKNANRRHAVSDPSKKIEADQLEIRELQTA